MSEPLKRISRGVQPSFYQDVEEKKVVLGGTVPKSVAEKMQDKENTSEAVTDACIEYLVRRGEAPERYQRQGLQQRLDEDD